jgi:hypothetical protein
MRKAGRVWTGIALLATCACSHPVHSTSTQPTAAVKVPTPPASPRSAAPAPPSGPSSPAASPTRSALPSATSAPSASPGQKPLSASVPAPPKHPVRLAPNARPQILDVNVSETRVQPGDRVFGRVITTSNVASVEARIGGYAVNLVKVGVGRFELTYTVGPLPFFVRGNFTMRVIARNTRGDTATRAIALTVR